MEVTGRVGIKGFGKRKGKYPGNRTLFTFKISLVMLLTADLAESLETKKIPGS